MIKINQSLIIIGIATLLVSCSKDRLFEMGNPTPIQPIDSTEKLIQINEFLAKGSQLTTDLGNASDWIELYNPGQKPLFMKAGEWFISDSPTDPEKFELPERTINAGDFLMIFCDDSNRTTSHIHTNFGLSSNGEHIALYHKTSTSVSIVDSTSFGVQTEENMSNSRVPDGSLNWVYPSIPTPGNPNQ